MKNFVKKTRRFLRQSRLGQTLVFASNYFKDNSYVLSYPKSGRTWAATVVMHYVGKRKGLINDALPFSLSPVRDYPELFILGRKAVFSHDIMAARIHPEKLKKRFSLLRYGNKPIAFIVRNPRDVVVSYYHHVKQRRQKTKLLEETSLDEFIHMPQFGLERIVTLYNMMYEFSEQQGSIKFFHYEDLRGKGDYDIDTWEALFSFIFQEPVDRDALAWALEISRFDQMRKREGKDSTLKPDARRVRKGEVGGYKGEMNSEAQAYVDRFIAENLHDFYRSYKYNGGQMPDHEQDKKVSI